MLAQQIRYDSLVKRVYDFFGTIDDPRNRSIEYRFRDFLMSAFAMFAIKYPSLLQFESQSSHEKDNLKRLFRVGKLCSDVQMRKALDKVDAGPLRKQFVNYFNGLKGDGILKSYEVLNKAPMVATIPISFQSNSDKRTAQTKNTRRACNLGTRTK